MESLGYNEETIAAMELGLCGGIGPVLGRILIEHFGSARAVFGAAPAALLQIPGVSQKAHYNIIHSTKSNFDEAREYAKKHIALGRFAHECCTLYELEDKRVVAYSGDDSNDEHLYKFKQSGLSICILKVFFCLIPRNRILNFVQSM